MLLRISFVLTILIGLIWNIPVISIFAETTSMPALMLTSINPSGNPDSVSLICNSDIDLKDYTISDLDGTDTPVSGNSLPCAKNQKITLSWISGTNITTGSTWQIYSPDTAFTNTKDQIAVIRNDGVIIDGVVYWDGTSIWESTTEASDIQALIGNNVWDSNTSTASIIIGASEIWHRIGNGFGKTHWSKTETNTATNENSNSNANSNNSTTENTNSNTSVNTNTNTEINENNPNQNTSTIPTVGNIRITEVVPNPEGDDANEYVMISNLDIQNIDISGWSISNGTKIYLFPTHSIVKSQQNMTLNAEILPFSLLNAGMTLILLDKNNIPQQEFTYTEQSEGAIFSWQNNTVQISNAENTTNTNDNTSEIENTENTVNESLEEIDTTQTLNSASSSSSNSRTSYSPQVGILQVSPNGFIEKFDRSIVPLRQEAPYITGIYYHASEQDSLYITNPNPFEMNLADYTLTVGKKDIPIQGIIRGLTEGEFPLDLPKTKTTLSLGRGNIASTIAFSPSTKNGNYYLLNTSTAEWYWSKTPKSGETLKSYLPVVSPQKNGEKEKSEKKSTQNEKTSSSNFFPVAEASGFDKKQILDLFTLSPWWYGLIAILILIAIYIHRRWFSEEMPFVIPEIMAPKNEEMTLSKQYEKKSSPEIAPSTIIDLSTIHMTKAPRAIVL